MMWHDYGTTVNQDSKSSVGCRSPHEGKNKTKDLKIRPKGSSEWGFSPIHLKDKLLT